jgi:hypothetical protein
MSLLKNILTSFITKNVNSNNNIESLNTILNKYQQSKLDIIDSTIENIEIDLDPNLIYTDNDNDNNDENREYKNFCTDIVTNYILDEKELYNLLYIIHTFYNDCIDYYIEQKNLKSDDIIFLFKGGNIFKIIANKFWSELPNKAMYKFINEYKSYFKRSDLDFGIYINPDLSMNIIDDITIISYKLQVLISEILLTHKEICFKWFKYNDKYKQEILQNLLFDINKTESLQNSSSIYYNNKFTNIQFIDQSAIPTSNNYKNQTNNYFTFENDNVIDLDNLSNSPFNNRIIRQKINHDTHNNNNFMYNNINKALRIRTTNNRILKFYLTRIKITFNLHLENKINQQNIIAIGGELIDVSIGRDESSANFYKNKNNYIDSINLTQNTSFYINSVKTFNLNIYSFQYLYEDLKFILIDTLYLPWEDLKYKKRLYRLFFLTFIDVFKNIKKKPIQNKHINSVYEYFSSILNYIKKFKNNENTEKNIKEISTILKKTKQDKILSYIICKKNKCLLNKLLKYIISIIEKVLFPRQLINTKIHDNLFINNNTNNKRKLNDNEFENLIDLLNYVLFNLDSFKIVNEYIVNYSKSTLEFNYKNIDSDELI